MKRCMDPILCFTDGTKKQYRNYSFANPVFKLKAQYVFDCRKCIFCRKKQSTELAHRCVLHASLYKQNSFLTLTYDPKLPGYHNNFEYTDIQKFKKSLRRHCEYHHGKKIQIFNVHEYGKNGQKHWHLVVFNHDFTQDIFKKQFCGVEFLTQRNGHKYYTSKVLTKIWPYGHHTIGNVTEASAMYQAQYTQKDFQYGYVKSNKQSHSKHSGIGRDYFLRHYKQILELGYIPISGRKVPIPRYFERLAHMHYSYFFEPENFYDTERRKRLYSLNFRHGPPNEEIAQLYMVHRDRKQIRLQQAILDWELEIEDYIFNNKKPAFAQAGENKLHDLQNKMGGKL